ncbi:MAG TPA: response regulator [Methanotrichaceae archaeon]|nr:response regulator [Methanotrichaceae archaeon]
MSAGNREMAAEERLRSNQELLEEIRELKSRLHDAEELTRAISGGEVDALVVSGPGGEQVFTLEGADHAYRILIETMNEGAVILSQERIILYCNRHFADMTKTSLPEVLGSAIQPFIEPSHLALFEALLQHGLGSREIALQPRNGTTLPTYLSVSELKIEEGQRAWCLVFTDLTEQKRNEEMVAAEKLARSIIEQAAEAVVVCDDQGKIIRFSNMASRICGRDPTFKHFDEVFDLERSSADEKISPVSAALQGSILLRDEVRFEREDGKVFYLLLNSGPLRGADDRIVGCVVTLADISDLKLAEEILRESHDDLEARVKERTSELSQAKEELEVINEELLAEISEHERLENNLIAAKESAEAAVQAKASFMANMSHELRTPMNAIIGMTSLLLDEPLTADQKDFLETIRNSGDSLLTLINEVLDFSKLEREKAELEYQPFDLRRCIEDALDLVTAKAADKNLDLAYAMDGVVPEIIIGDPARLRQVLTNLLDNAVKFTERGEVEAYIKGRSLDSGGYEISFEIRDTGVGIPMESMGKLFHAFSQVDQSYAKKYPGTGLGLAICKRLVELMGGKIWVDSELGLGSKFCFTITADGEKSTHHCLLKKAHPQLSGKQVLIVDDSRLCRKILGRQAQVWGMVPMVVATPREALMQVQREGAFDLAIVSSRVPGLTRPTIAEEIRKYCRSMPLVVLSQVGRRPKIESAAHLTKPIKPLQLYDVLIKAMNQRSVQELAEAEAVADHSALRILLAEDNVSNQKVTMEMLKKLGYRADIASNGAEALESLERQHYDVILMDVRMPVMNGLEATKAIRKRWPFGPKIVAITAYALHGDKEKCLAAGMDDYISKPVKLEELKAVLELQCCKKADEMDGGLI